MDIPYTVKPRPDVGLYNAKLGIWLFLASEVMLFGGLFSAYILLRVGAAPGYWPHGWLDVRFGTLNTIILALSAITTLLAWVACKVGQFAKFKFFHACTLLLALSFLCVKMYEYHDKWIHYEIKLTDGTFADGHLVESAVYVDKATNKELEKHSFRGAAFSEISGGVTNSYELVSVTLEGRIVNDETLLYDLRSQKTIQRERSHRFNVRRHQADAKLRAMAQHVPRDLFHAHRPARAAHSGRQHRHRLSLGAGKQNVEARPGAFHQPHRGVRPVLAFCGLGLDFPVPGLIFDVTNL